MELFVATIAGALVAFLGVLLTLRWNQKAHEENLREEREKKREEREFIARQQSLIYAAESVTKFLGYYLTIPDRVLPQDGSVANEITEMDVALNKLHFYCSLETIKKSTELGNILSRAAAEAMKAKLSSILTLAEISGIDIEISGIERMNTTLNEEIRALLSSGDQSSLIATHRQQLATNFKDIATLCERKVELIKRKYIETEECRDVVSSHLRTIYEAMRDILLLARRELSFPIEEENYKEIMNSRIDGMEKSLRDFFAEIRKQAVEKMQ